MTRRWNRATERNGCPQRAELVQRKRSEVAVEMGNDHRDSTAASSRRWLLYALGGGLGHVTRAVALARAAVAHSLDASPPRIWLLTNSPFADSLPLESELDCGRRIVRIDPDWSRDAVARYVQELLGKVRPDVTIVDTFPRGLGGELVALLPALRCHKVLVHRDLNPAYVEQMQIAEVLGQYDRLLVPGEQAVFADHPHAVATPPWLIRDAGELLPEQEARRMLKVRSDHVPVVAVIGCGKHEEIKELRELASALTLQLAERAEVRFITPALERKQGSSEGASSQVTSLHLWPFLQAIRGVSVIVGSGGYNTVHEARATGTRLIACPRSRLYDRQDRRLRRQEKVLTIADMHVSVVAAVEQAWAEGPRRVTSYPNGATEAVAAIEALYI